MQLKQTSRVRVKQHISGCLTELVSLCVFKQLLCP